ncbi:hypothetical protein ACGYLI_17155 [Sulfitobacter sp. 1A13421]|uniref:hypothetical protein n=1 Tax=Sulfitobacter sp. 1A13421 TaxID=3368595 RepID=UPI0037476A24
MTDEHGPTPPKRVVEVLSESAQPGKIYNAAAREARKEAERTKAKDAIYSALSRWVGETVHQDVAIPMVRDGKRIGTMQQTILGQGREVDDIVAASKLMKASELRKLRDDYNRISKRAVQLADGLTSLDPADLFKLGAAPRNATYDTDTKVIRAIGIIPSLLISLPELLAALEQQTNYLEKKLDTSGAALGRSKNEAAHGVALRLAKLYARVTGKRPTYSEGPNGLSGEYTPALRSVFDALGWKTVSLKSPAEAAISQITDEDLQPYVNALSYGLLSYPLE